MTAYIANHEKKKRIFAKRERELVHAIRRQFAVEKLMVAAEKLRSAKIGVAKCRFAKHSEKQPYNFSAEETALRDKELQLWLTMSADEIVHLYRPQVA
jgi:hypothetical protein